MQNDKILTLDRGSFPVSSEYYSRSTQRTLLLAFALVVFLLAGCAPQVVETQVTAQLGDEVQTVQSTDAEEAKSMQPTLDINAPRSDTIREIDAQAPTDFETATFALG
jgi:hypothetical protein